MPQTEVDEVQGHISILVGGFMCQPAGSGKAICIIPKQQNHPANMVSIDIQPVTFNDLETLHKISRQTFYETFAAVNTEENMRKYLDEALSVEKLTAELSNPQSAFYFATLEGQVVGYLKLNTGSSQTELPFENGLELERIYVLNDFRGKSVGQQLFDKAIHLARQLHVDTMWLGVWEENLSALNFYRKNGMVAFDQHVFKLGDDEQTDLLMKLTLHPTNEL